MKKANWNKYLERLAMRVKHSDNPALFDRAGRIFDRFYKEGRYHVIRDTYSSYITNLLHRIHNKEHRTNFPGEID